MTNIPVTRTPQAFDALYVRNEDGEYVPVNTSGGGDSVSWDDIADKPASFPPTIGTTSTTAKAGDAIQTAGETTATPIAPGTATNVQDILAELAARIVDLEAAAG